MSNLPSVLIPNNRNENQSARVESIFLPPSGFNFTDSGNGQATFRIPKKGILNSNSVLEYKVLWSAEDVGANSLICTPQRLTGILPIRDARLYIGGVLVDQLNEASNYMSLKQQLGGHAKKVGVQDVKLGSDNQYKIDRLGRYKLEGEVAHADAGTKAIMDDRAPECQIRISDLFGLLKDVELPVAVLPDVIIEIDWETDGNKVIANSQLDGSALTLDTFVANTGEYFPNELCDGTGGTGSGIVGRATIGNVADAAARANRGVATAVAVVEGGKGYTLADTITWIGRESGALATGGSTATTNVATINASPVKTLDMPRKNCNLILDFVHYQDPAVMKLIEDSANAGLNFNYRSRNLVKKQIPAVGNGDTATTDIQLGFQNKYIQRILCQKLNTAIVSTSATASHKATAQVMLNQRSDRVEAEKLQLFINNKPLFDQELDQEPFMYSILNQTFDEGMLAVPSGAYSEEYTAALNTANNLGISSEVVNSGNATHGIAYAEYMSGRQNWKSFPLMASNSAQVNPSNAIKSGASPSVLRYVRTGSAVNESQQAVDMNIWVETIKNCNIRDGLVNVNDA